MLKLNSPQTLLVLDWDGTLAKRDTLSLIAPSPQALELYTEAYLNDSERLKEQFGERNTLSKMTAFLQAMQVEYSSVRRVEEGGLFKGMSRSSMLERAQDNSHLSLQNGALAFLKTFKGCCGIVSVGWSGEFITAALKARGIDTAAKAIQMRANEIDFDEYGIGTGKLSKHMGNDKAIRVASDKLREMNAMMEQFSRTRLSRANGTVIYIGDSETDLLCLLAADAGIIMNNQKMVKLCRSLDLNVQDGLDQFGTPDQTKPNLFSVQDFTELYATGP